MMQWTGVENVKDKFAKLSEVMQQQLVNRASRILFDSAKARIDTQTDTTGAAFTERKDKANKQKMLIGLKARLNVTIQGNQAIIGFDDARTAIIANRQQTGGSFEVTKGQANRTALKQQPATIRQATELVKLGFKVKNRRPSVKWILENYTINQAGFFLKQLREQQGIQTKTSWTVTIPARSFLAATDNDIEHIKQSIIQELESVL